MNSKLKMYLAGLLSVALLSGCVDDGKESVKKDGDKSEVIELGESKDVYKGNKKEDKDGKDKVKEEDSYSNYLDYDSIKGITIGSSYKDLEKVLKELNYEISEFDKAENEKKERKTISIRTDNEGQEIFSHITFENGVISYVTETVAISDQKKSVEYFNKLEKELTELHGSHNIYGEYKTSEDGFFHKNYVWTLDGEEVQLSINFSSDKDKIDYYVNYDRRVAHIEKSITTDETVEVNDKVDEEDKEVKDKE